MREPNHATVMPNVGMADGAAAWMREGIRRALLLVILTGIASGIPCADVCHSTETTPCEPGDANGGEDAVHDNPYWCPDSEVCYDVYRQPLTLPWVSSTERVQATSDTWSASQISSSQS